MTIVKSYTCGAADLEEHVMVKIASGLVVKCGAGDACHGVTKAPASVGSPVSVIVQGEALVQCAAALASGVEFTTDADGYAVAVTSGDARQGIVSEGAIAPSGGLNDRAKVILSGIKPGAA